MIDFRLKTFLILAQVKNYTKTAELLFISQPAVSQHIKHLEEEYQTSLFEYKDKKLRLTSNGEILYNFLVNVDKKSKDILQLMINNNLDVEENLIFGTTLTIGEYLMPEILNSIYCKYPFVKIHMVVENTESLLDKLNNGEIDFALLEGQFDKSKYDYKLLSKEEFIGICSKENDLSKSKVSFEDIFNQRLLIREKGSGSREIFEHILYEHNYKMNSFDSFSEIGNINVIKELVSLNKGISFMYKRAVNKELSSHEISKISISDFNVTREFNFVYLKHSLDKQSLNDWFNIFLNSIK